MFQSWVVGLALLSDTVPQEHLAQAFGYVTLGLSLGLLIAPLLAGVVFERAGYTAVFAMAYALVGFDILLRLALVEKKVAARWLPVQDQPEGSGGNTLESTNQESGLVVSSSGPHTTKEAGLLPSHSTNVEKASIESSQPQPIPGVPQARNSLRSRLPPVLSLLYSRRLLSALFGALIQAALITAFDSVLALRAAKIFGWQSTGAGLLFLPLVLPSFLAPVVGYLTDRIGARYPAGLGFLLAAPPLVCLRFVTENSLRQKVLLCALLALIGLALTFTMPPVMAEISKVVEAKEKNMAANGEKGWGKGGGVAQAFGLYNMAFAGGCLVGPLLAGFIADEKGWNTMSWVLGLLSAVTAVPTWLWMEGWIGKDLRRDGHVEAV
jgi:MFS family permease